MDKPIAIYTDHIINRTLCYNFAKGSGSLLCHVKNFKEYDKTIATYGVLRGTHEIIKKVKNFIIWIMVISINQGENLKIIEQVFLIWTDIFVLYTII